MAIRNEDDRNGFDQTVTRTSTSFADQSILVAQAETTTDTAPESSSDASPATEPTILVVELTEGEIATLPESADLSQPRQNGADLEFVQPDGSVIVIVGGAVTGLTIMLGDIEIPTQTVAALFEENGIEPAEGPGQGPAGDSHGNYDDAPIGNVGDGFGLTALIGPTELGFGEDNQNEEFVPTKPVLLIGDGFTEEDDLQFARLNESDGNNEDGSVDAQQTTGTLVSDFGTGGPAVAGALTFFGTLPTGLTSQGEAILFSITDRADGGQTLTAYVDEGGSPRNVFTLDLVVTGSGTSTATGSYVFTLNDQLDHLLTDNPDTATVEAAFEDIMALGFGIKATNGFGLHDEGTLTIGVQDDIPVFLGGSYSVTVDEDNLSTLSTNTYYGTGGYQVDSSEGTSPNKYSETHFNGVSYAWGDVNALFKVGSDEWQDAESEGGSPGDGMFSLSSDGLDELRAQGLTSKGAANALDYQVVDQGNGEYSLYGFVPDGTGSGRLVLQVDLYSDGGFQVKLFDQIDHPATDDPSTGATENAFEDTFGLDLSSILRASDFDGDTIGVPQGTLIVNIVDDVPVVTNNPLNITLDEDDIDTGLSTGTSPISSGDPASASGSFASLVTVGADEGVTFSFVTSALADLNARQFTSGGDPISFVIDGDVLRGSATGSAGVRTVFEFTLQADGSYDIALFDQVDHVAPASGADENTDILAGGSSLSSIPLGYIVQATDADGDTVVLGDKVTLTVTDDVPVIGTADNGVVEEEQGAVAGAGNEELFQSAGDPDFGIPNVFFSDTLTNKASGSLSVSWGADDADNEALPAGTTGNRAVAFDGLTALTALNLTSRGDAVSFALAADDTILTATAGGRVVFTVTLSDDGAGSWDFVLKDTIDHKGNVQGEDLQALEFAFVATDSDGDAATSTFTVNVMDDKPVALGAYTGTVEEEELTGGNEDTAGGGYHFESLFSLVKDDADTNSNDTKTSAVADGSLNILWGGDDSNVLANGGFNGTQVAGDRSVAFDVANPTANSAGALRTLTASEVNAFISVRGPLDASDLTSEGRSITYTLSANNTVLTATAGGETIFTATLSDTGSGGYNFVLSGTLDHPDHAKGASNEDSLDFTFRFAARDGDGDVDTSSFEVRVIDDAPIKTADAENSRVDEDGLAGGLAGDAYPGNAHDISGEAILSTGALNIAWGADAADAGVDSLSGNTFIQDTTGGDGNRSVAFRGNTISDLEAKALTSGGDDVHFVFNADQTILLAYRGSVTDFDSVDTDDMVFRVSLTDEGSGAYNFELLGALDHSVSGSEDNIRLDFNFRALDSDGDRVNGNFTVRVNDDGPVVAANAAAMLDDDNLGGNALGVGDDSPANTHGTLNHAYGADGAGSLLLTAPELPASGGFSSVISNGGLVLTISQIQDGNPVDVVRVVLTDTSSGDYTVTQLAPIDHPAGGDENNVDFIINYQVIDGDGDVADGQLALSVDDDSLFVIGTVLPRIVEEEELGDGNEDTSGSGDLDFNAGPFGFIDVVGSTTGAPLNILWGADDRDVGGRNDGVGREVYFSDTAVALNNIHITDAGGNVINAVDLKSGGQDLTFTLSEGNTKLVASSVSGEVFTVTLNDDGNGSYDFKLQGPLDHPSGNGENQLRFTFDFTAEDADGDTRPGDFEVRVIDDVPAPDLDVVSYVRVDETHGDHSDNVYNSGSDSYDPDVVALFAGLTAPAGTDPDLAQPIFARYDIIDYDAKAGADGLASAVLSLRVDDAQSGLKTTEGDDISLTLEGDLVVGRIASGEAAFAIHIDQTGRASIAQYMSLKHPNPNHSDEDINLLGKVSAILTVVDGDGDTVTKVAQIGESLSFDDDGPVVTGDGNTNVSVFESGVDAVSGVQPAGTLTANSTHATGNVGKVNFGADGFGDLSFSGAFNVPNENGDTLTAGGAGIDSGMTSDTRPVLFRLSSDGLTIEGYVADGVSVGTDEVILRVTLNGTDSGYSVDLFGNIDHQAPNTTNNRDDAQSMTFKVTATDGDGDSVDVNLNVRLNDDAPVVTGDGNTNVSVFESGVDAVSGVQPAGTLAANSTHATGNVGKVNFGADGFGDLSFSGAFNVPNENGDTLTAGGAGIDSGMTSDTRPVLFRLSSDGLTIEGYVADGVSVGTDEVILRVTLNGTDSGYSVDLFGNIDHQAPNTTNNRDDAQSMTFKVTATDGDGDSVDVNLNVRLNDDAPTATYSGRVTVTEDATGGVFDAQVATGQFKFDGGADGAEVTSISYGLGSVSAPTASDPEAASFTTVPLTSGGEPLEIVYSNGGLTLTAQTSGGTPIFTVVVTNAQTGAYTFTQLGPIDHPDAGETGAADPLRLKVGFTVTDGDGDTASSSIQIDILDDAPVINAPDTGSVTENGNDVAVANASFDDQSLMSGQPGVIDNVLGNYTHAAPSDWAISGQGGMFAPVDSISEQDNHDGSNVVWLRNGATLSQNTGEIVAGGDVYTLNFNVGDRTDQSWPGGEARIIATNGVDTVVLASVVLPTPADGDWASVTLQSGLIDPAYAGYELRIEVQQNSAGGGNQILVDDIELSHFISATDSGSLGVNWGADDAAIIGVAFDASMAGVTSLTSEGSAISYVLSANNTLLTAVSDDGREIFTVSLANTGNGAYNFTLLDNLDHVPAGNDASVDLTFAFTATDGDGDTASSSFHIDILDDAPTATYSGRVTVTEDATGGVFDAQVATGQFKFDGGADGAEVTSISYGLGSVSAPAASDPEAASFTTVPLTSGGEPLEIVYSPDGLTLTAQTNGGTPIFTVVVTNAQTGAYTFTQLGPIDHPDAGETGAADPLRLKVGFTVTDGDGDTASSSIQIDILDDAPTIGMVGINEDGPSNDFEPDAALLTQAVTNALGTLSSAPDGLSGVLATVQGEVGDLPTAFAVVWDYLDDGYVGAAPAQVQSLNEAFVRLGIAYADYVKNGGTPLTDMVAKFTPDGGDAGTLPDRVQSMHDNLLGNLWESALNGRFSGQLLTDLKTLINAVDPDLLSRPYYDGNEGHDPSATRQWDLDNGFLSVVGASVDEDDLANGTDATKESTTTSGDLGINWGADSADAAADGATQDMPGAFNRSVVFDPTLSGDSGLTAGGLAVSYALNADGTVLTASTTNGTVFTVSLFDDGTGSFDFTLEGALDHPTGNGENGLDLGFGIIATDADGDSTTGGFSVVVQDDGPTASLSISNGDRWLTIDETPGHQINDEVNTSSVFDDLANKSADLLEVQYGRATGFLTTTGTSYGADGAGSTVFGLSLNGVGAVASGMSATIVDGGVSVVAAISLFEEVHGGKTFIVGRYDASNGVIDGNDPAAFALYLEPATGILHLAQYASLEHGNTNSNNELLNLPTGLISVEMTVTDGDGDTAFADYDLGGHVRFYDDGPVLTGVTHQIALDEDDINTLLSKGSDNDADTNAAGAASATGSLATLVNVGADNLAAFGFTANAVNLLNGLQFYSNGDLISFAIVGDTLRGTATDGVVRTVFEFTLNADGTYNAQLFDQVDHVAPTSGADENTDIMTSAGPLAALPLGQIITVTDGDGDSVVLGGNLTLTVTDDIPVPASQTIKFTGVDETAGLQSSLLVTDTDSSAATAIFAGVVNPGTDVDMPDYQYAQKVGFVSSIAFPGADEPTGYDYSIAIGATTNSGISVQIGNVTHIVHLSMENGILVGRADLNDDYSVDENDPAVFALHLANDGTLTMAQFLPIMHGDTGNPDDFVALAGNSYDLFFGFTDNDGDRVVREFSADNAIRFYDDGPTASLSISGGDTWLTIDETPGLQVNDEVSTSSVFDDLANKSADLLAAQYGRETDLLTKVVNYGADGAGSTVFALSLSGAGAVASGMSATIVDGGASVQAAISLFEEVHGGKTFIVGRYDAANGSIDGSDPAAFALYVDPATGALHLAQYASLAHGNTNSLNELLNLPTSLVSLGMTVTDGDGDKAFANIDLGNHVRFHDDGPSFTGADYNGVDAGNGAVPTVDTITTSATGDLVFDFGVDGPKSSDGDIVFGTNAASGGLTYTLNAAGTLLTATMTVGGATAFTVMINPDNTFSFDVMQAGLVHFAGANPTPLTFNIVGSDGDGDKADGAFQVNVDGYQAPTGGNLAVLTVDEAALDDVLDAADIAVSLTTTGTNPTSGAETNTTTLAFTAGSLALGSFGFADPSVTAPSVDAGLDDGVDVVWLFEGSNLVGKIGGITAIILSVSGAAVAAGTTSNVDIKVTLTDAFPHQDSPDADQLIISGIKVTATDGVSTVDGTVKVTVLDDTPEIFSIQNAITANQIGTLEGLIDVNSGADGLATYKIDGVTGLPNGWSVSGTGSNEALIKDATDTDIFKLSISSSGTYALEQLAVRPGTETVIEAAESFPNSPVSSYDFGFALFTALTSSSGQVVFNANTIGGGTPGNEFGIGNPAFTEDESFKIDFDAALSNMRLEFGSVDHRGILRFTVTDDGINSIIVEKQIEESDSSVTLTPTDVGFDFTHVTVLGLDQSGGSNDIKVAFTNVSYTEAHAAQDLNLTVSITAIDGDGDTSTSTLEVVNYGEAAILSGTSDADSILGNAQANTLNGLAGDDFLTGGNGDDIIIGGAGYDVMHGGLGADTFALTTFDIADLIADYDGGQGDKVDLTALFDTPTGVANVADFVNYNSTTGMISVDSDGGANGAVFVDVGTLGETTHPAPNDVTIIFDDGTGTFETTLDTI